MQLAAKDEARYAIYLVPAHDDLANWGNAVVGRGPESLKAVPQPNFDGIETDTFREATKAPRWYGFHATLKSPFPLAPGKTEAELCTAVKRFTATQQAFSCRLKVGEIGGFIALIPELQTTQLSDLAAACVRVFDPFRAPLDDYDRARRNPDALSLQQRHYLEKWGYPYVFEEFRFHMTLTGRIENTGLRSRIVEHLSRQFFRDVDPDCKIARLGLFHQQSRGHPFTCRATFDFGATTAI